MKNTTRILLAGIIALGIIIPASAELRIWTDNSGKTIEAEHVRTMDDKVVLKRMDGTEIRVSLDSLTEKDRRYAVLLAPPRVEIKVSTKVDRENKSIGPVNRGSGVQVQQETVQATIEIGKTSSAPYEAPMLSEIYLIGETEQSDRYVVLDQSKSKFQFSSENKNEHVYKSGTVNLRQVEAGYQAGVEYKGYLAIVRDRTGEIIGMKCSKLAFEKNADAIIGSAKGTVFDGDFNPVDRKAAKQEAKKSGDLPSQKRMPGRRF